ncbi:arf-GAP with GTPase, ANK repeat and PH domain-containing protein 1-like isoform X4 [Arapaima gigas]
MNSNPKLVLSTAIRTEVKRHENIKNTINKFFKQLERVGDLQLRNGLKMYLHGIQGGFLCSSAAFCTTHRYSLPDPQGGEGGDSKRERLLHHGAGT